MTRRGVCICPTCEDRHLIVRLDPAWPRCPVCAWLLSPIPEDNHQPEEGGQDDEP